MAEEEQQSAKIAVQEKKIQEKKAQVDLGMKFDYNDPYKKAVKQPEPTYTSESLFQIGAAKKATKK